MLDPKAVLDLGMDRTLRFTTTGDGSGEADGFIEEHPDQRDPSQRCFGSGGFDTEAGHRAGFRTLWRVVSADPLTLEPSILCRICGNHGWVREGKWTNA